MRAIMPRAMPRMKRSGGKVAKNAAQKAADAVIDKATARKEPKSKNGR